MNPVLQDLAGKRLVLGLTGGIACYKSAELTRRLIERGAEVTVVMTAAATHFITPTTMQALSGRRVFIDQWDAGIANTMPHIELSRAADAILVAPATADFMAKLAHGRADDLLSALCLARECPLLVAPAMNRQMWDNPATQRNVAMLAADGIALLGPASGDQACGEIGMGRLLEPAEIIEDLLASFQPKRLRGMEVLITAGPTYEPIDPVRGITNLSSGKMGFAIARAAREAGARVTLVAGPTALATPRGVQRVDVQDARQMLDEVMRHVKSAKVFIAVAAVADWRVEHAASQKIKKSDAASAPGFSFVQNPDILATVAALDKPPYCVGFAAESENLEAHAEVKRRKKNVPLLVGNIGHATFGHDDNELILFDEKGATRLARADKLELARHLVAEIAARIQP